MQGIDVYCGDVALPFLPHNNFKTSFQRFNGGIKIFCCFHEGGGDGSGELRKRFQESHQLAQAKGKETDFCYTVIRSERKP